MVKYIVRLCQFLVPLQDY